MLQGMRLMQPTMENLAHAQSLPWTSQVVKQCLPATDANRCLNTWSLLQPKALNQGKCCVCLWHLGACGSQPEAARVPADFPQAYPQKLEALLRGRYAGIACAALIHGSRVKLVPYIQVPCSPLNAACSHASGAQALHAATTTSIQPALFAKKSKCIATLNTSESSGLPEMQRLEPKYAASFCEAAKLLLQLWSIATDKQRLSQSAQSPAVWYGGVRERNAPWGEHSSFPHTEHASAAMMCRDLTAAPPTKQVALTSRTRNECSHVSAVPFVSKVRARRSFSAQAPPDLRRMACAQRVAALLPLDDTKSHRAGAPKNSVAEIKPERLADLDAIPARARGLQAARVPGAGRSTRYAKRRAAPEPKVWHFRGLDCAPPCAHESVAV